MPEMNELAEQLTKLSHDYYGDKRANRETAFMDKYGSKFGNDRGLGLAILEELDGRGIDTSAADEAVQGIVDDLRGEINQLRTLLGAVEEKTEAIKDAVDSAVSGNPDSSGAAEPEMPPAEPAADIPAEGAAESEVPAETAPGAPAKTPGGTPAEEAPADTAAGSGSELPPEIEQMKQEDNTLSDARLKKNKQCLSDFRMKRIKAKAAENSFRPSSSMLEIAQRGY